MLQSRFGQSLLTLAFSLALPVLLLAAGGAGATDLPRVTVIGDSVGGALAWEGASNATLGEGFDVRVDWLTCRKLTKPGCNDTLPESALAAVERLGPELGKIVVIEVGYNDTPDEVAAAIEPLMAALRRAGVEHVIWLDYVERLSEWVDSNAALRAAAPSFPELTIADWNAVARSHDDWFADTAHLTSAGARALAAFLHPLLVDACGSACAPPPPPPPPVYCGLARTVNGFDYVQSTNLACPSARGASVSIERGVRGPWVCSRLVGASVELSCTAANSRIDLLERSPVPATRHGAAVVLSNWTFRLRGRVVLGRPAGRLRWQTLARRRWCVPEVPREVLTAFGLTPTTPHGGCFRH
jgi:hypothetical protein